jgi:hypothetical protein
MELARFEQFWAEDTIEGTVPFIIANPIRNNKPLTTADGTPLTKRSSTPEGDGEPLLVSAHWLVMFGDDTPTISVASGLLYSIQYPLVIMP